MVTQSSFDIRNIANVVHSWLAYLYEVSEIKHLATESSLRYPITGLLERKVEGTEIQLEKTHPYFLNKRIDFFWRTGNVENYMEMKYVRNSNVDVQKILDDVFRLALINKERTNKYFLVCGKIEDFQKFFQKYISNKAVEKQSGKLSVLQNGNVNNLLDHYFSFCEKDNIKRFSVKEDKYFKSFREEYKSCCKNYSIPAELTINTELIQPIDKGLKSAVAIWKIS